jgi:hypothetical protein
LQVSLVSRVVTPPPLVALAADLAAAPRAWLGEAGHLVLMGGALGTDLDVAVLSAPVLAGIAVEREYAPAAGGRLVCTEIEIAAAIPTAAGPARLEIEIEVADLGSLTLPAELALGSAAGLALDLPAGCAQGWTGSLQLIRDEGVRDIRGLARGGRVAGYLRAERGEDWLVLSFTLPVTSVEIDLPQPAPDIAPERAASKG